MAVEEGVVIPKLIFAAFSALAQLYVAQDMVRDHIDALLTSEQAARLHAESDHVKVRILLLEFAGQQQQEAIPALQSLFARKSTLKLLLRRFGVDTSWVDGFATVAEGASPDEFIELLLEHIPQPKSRQGSEDTMELIYNPQTLQWEYKHV